MEEKPTALDAINEALGDAAAAPPEDEIVEETPAEETPEETSEEASEEGEGEAPADDATDEEAEEKGYARDPVTGKFVKKEAKPEGEQKLDKDGKPIVDKPKKAADPVNDPIPKDLKQETQARIRTLIETTKTVTAERDAIKRDFDYIVNGLQATGTTPEQYGETLSWLAMFNSNDPEQQRKALELVETVAERMALQLGVERQAADPLAAHRDLQEAIQKGQISAQYAKEIARNRNAQAFRGEIQNATTQQQQQIQQREQELNNGRQALNNIEAQLKATDPQYEAKKAVLIPVLQPLFAKIPPSQWEGAFREAYSRAVVPAAPKAKVPANQPMRANKNPAGGGTKGANSMRDAIDGALAAFK